MKPADYQTVTQAAGDNGISRQRVALLAKQGRIKGAVKIGNAWLIPVTWKHKPGELTRIEKGR